MQVSTSIPCKAVVVGVEAVQTTRLSYTVLEVQSQTSDKVYRVDVTNKRCSCPAWKFQTRRSEGKSLCKHLKSLGFTELVQSPAKSQNDPLVVDGITLL